MFVPLMGFLIKLLVFSLIGILVLSLIRRPMLRPLTLGAFLLGAFGGSMLYEWLYLVLVADASGMLTTRASVICFLVGIPISAGVFGWASAWLASRIFPSEQQKA